MKIVLYLMAVLAGAFGVLCMLRGVESYLNGSFAPTSLILGIIGIFLALLWIKRARS